MDSAKPRALVTQESTTHLTSGKTIGKHFVHLKIPVVKGCPLGAFDSPWLLRDAYRRINDIRSKRRQVQALLTRTFLQFISTATMRADVPSILAAAVFVASRLPTAGPPLGHALLDSRSVRSLFEDRTYLYASYKIHADVLPNSGGDHLVTRGYHVFLMNSTTGPITDHGLALTLEDIPWTNRQLSPRHDDYRDSTLCLLFQCKQLFGVLFMGHRV